MVELSGRRPVVVVGAGVIGLQLSRELARRDVPVTLLEAREIGAGASGAAIGALSAPVKSQSAYARLSREGLDRYGTLCEELRRETGIDCRYRVCGSLRLRRGLPRFPEREIAWWRAAGVRAEWVGLDEIRAMVHGCGGEFPHALRLDREATLEPRELCRALAASCRLLGVDLREGLGAIDVVIDGERVLFRERETGRAIDVPGGALPVVTAGVETQSVLGDLAAGAVETVPVRGQALELEMDAPQAIVRFEPSFLEREIFLVPRDERRVWLGSTLEEVGCDARTTMPGRAELLRAARELLADLRDSQVTRQWAGLRAKALQKGGPYLGSLPSCEAVWVAAGLFKTGVLQAPAVARILADALVDGVPIDTRFGMGHRRTQEWSGAG